MTNQPSDRWAAIVSDSDRHSTSEIEGLLAPLGFNVVAVPDLESVVAAVGAHERALVLAAPANSWDYVAQWCRELREHAKQCYVAFLLSQYRDTDVAAAFEAGADDVLVKPVIPVELRARMQRAVRMLALEEYREHLNGEAILLSEISARARMHSRRYLQAQLGNEIDRARRFSHALAVILTEVTGSRSDERLLRSLGMFLNNFVRAHVDWVARYSDRSFALVLPETTLLGAVRAAHRLRAALTQATLASAGLPKQLKLSFGVSALDQVSAMDLPDTKLLMDSAEAYLLEAVRSGPDQIVGGHPQTTH